MCYSLENIKLTENQGIIITMSQIARTKVITQLTKAGFTADKDFFLIEEFLSVYYAYKYNKVYFSSISFLPSTRCNLNCRYCLNFNPFAKEFFVRDLPSLKMDVDLFFQCVERIMLFHISGGEPFLYKNITDIIEYIDSNYGNKIDKLRTVTNGTIIPSDKVCNKLSKCNIEVTIDDYTNALPKTKNKLDMLVKKFKEYGIKHYINKVDNWINLAPEATDFSNMPEDFLIKHRDECTQSWQELRNGKLYNCNYASYASVAGIAGEEDIEEVYDLSQYNSSKAKELIEFRLGFTTKGYTNFCKTCRGFKSTNNIDVPAAMQSTGLLKIQKKELI